MSPEWWPWFWGIVAIGLVGIAGYSSTMLMRVIDQRVRRSAEELRAELAELKRQLQSGTAGDSARLAARVAELENRMDHAERVLPAGNRERG